jgi:hypothetical protein
MNLRSGRSLALQIALACFAVAVYAQNANTNTKDGSAQDDTVRDCPMHKQHISTASHHSDVEKHGDQAMGFPHDQTTHHFLLRSDGGAIEITANDPADQANTSAIRGRLSHIAASFADGDFSTPMFIHDGLPPGVTTMQLLKTKIRYHYEEMSSGARVRIESDDPVALAAIHDFLRFQISEHQTGDSPDYH